MPPVRVMVVDDDPAVSRYLHSTLEAHGYEVAGHAKGGQEAVDLAQQLVPDVILMDVFLGEGADGVDAARAIQQTIDTSIIFMSGRGDDAVVSHAVRTGAVGYILKPFHARQMTSSIEVALHQRMEAQARRLEGGRITAPEPARPAPIRAAAPAVKSPVQSSSRRVEPGRRPSTAPERTVPARALILSLFAMGAAIVAAVLWPGVLLDQEMLASVLALLPALLLAHYRRWTSIEVLLGGGIAFLSLLHVVRQYLHLPFEGLPYVLVVAPYIAIALGAGWFAEIRRFKAELRTTQLQLIQSEKLDSLGRMAAGVAHEVKNPLTTILLGVKLLSKRLATADDSTRQLLDDMSVAVARADKIVGGLLSYSRERDLDLTQVDLNATVDASVLLVKHELDKAQVQVTKDLDPSLPILPLDQFKIEQVFVNLLTNALHAIGQQGEIRVQTSAHVRRDGRSVGHRLDDRFRPGEHVALVQIEDSGPGIPEANLERVFDPFFTTKPTGVGTGLGLSVCQQIVEMHGGAIEIGNRAEGGARVRIYFKLAAQAEAA